MRPFPIPDFRQVVSVFADVLLVLDELVAQELLEMSADALQTRDTVDHVACKMKSIQVVENRHIERCGRCSFLFVSADMEVVMNSCADKLGGESARGSRGRQR